MSSKLDLEQGFITRLIWAMEINRPTFDKDWWWQEENPERCKPIPNRKFEFDFVHRRYPILVEIQGGTWMTKGGHNTGGGITRDCEKSNLAQAEGYTVFAFTSDLLARPEGLAPLVVTLNIHRRMNER